MAINIISSNLATYGNAGNYETDPSTWGFGTDIYRKYERTSAAKTKGIYSCKTTFLQPVSGGSDFAVGITRADVVAGKKYIVKAKVQVYAVDPIADNAAIININKLFGGVTRTQNDSIVVQDALTQFIEVSARFDCTTTWNNQYFNININQADMLVGGSMYIDEFEVYEYEELPDPECDIAHELGGSVINNETAPGANDGSITVAHTGTPRSSLEYSINGGSTWQASNQFTGLASGVYSIIIRETVDTSCAVTQAYVVNSGDPAFTISIAITHETIEGAANGKAVVTTTGNGAPFTYSKDGGATYQASNTLDNLAAGTHIIAVKDTSGNVVAEMITINAGIGTFAATQYTYNRIPFTGYATPAKLVEENHKIHLEVQASVDGGAYTRAITMKLPADADGKAIFNLSPAFRGLLEIQPPEKNSNSMTLLSDRVVFYKCLTGDIYDDMTEPATTTESDIYQALVGGIDKRRQADRSFFTDILPGSKQFLTWAPLVQEVDPNQEAYLLYYVFGKSVTQLKKYIKAYFDDGTTSTNHHSTSPGAAAAQYGKLYRVPVGPVHGGAIDYINSNNLVKYEVWLTDQDDNVISEIRTYKLTPFKRSNTRYLLLINSLGGEDVLRLTGITEEDAVIDKNIVQKHLPYGYSATDGEYSSSEISRGVKIKYNTGLVPTTAHRDHLQEILMSRQVYDITDGNRIPVVVKPGTFALKRNGYKYYLGFEAITGYSDGVFTPEGI